MESNALNDDVIYTYRTHSLKMASESRSLYITGIKYFSEAVIPSNITLQIGAVF